MIRDEMDSIEKAFTTSRDQLAALLLKAALQDDCPEMGRVSVLLRRNDVLHREFRDYCGMYPNLSFQAGIEFIRKRKMDHEPRHMVTAWDHLLVESDLG